MTCTVTKNDLYLNNQLSNLVYVNSFNEWHEGTAFEPMADVAGLTAAERRHGYHNPSWGSYRLAALKRAVASISAPAPAARPAPAA